MRMHMEVKTEAFRYLWLKYVTGFLEQYHCARCLEGKYSTLLPFRSKRRGQVFEGVLDEHDAPYLYLCGVTGRYEQNVHLAFQRRVNELVWYEDDSIAVRIEGAQRLAIAPLPDNVQLPAEFATCRNFQFGYQYLRIQQEAVEEEVIDTH